MRKFWRNRYFQYWLAFVVAFFFFLVPYKKDARIEKPSPMTLAGDTLNCNIMLDNTLKSKGFNMGYLYQIVQKFESYQKCAINLKPVEKNAMAQWVLLTTNKIDMLVINSQKDTVPRIFEDEFISSIPLNDKEDVLVVKKENYPIIQLFNYWFTFFKQTPEYAQVSNNFFKSYKIKDNFGAPISKKAISPYDYFVRKYAPLVGWDWRLICSLMYQESKFKLGVSSSKGAIGLMQIKEDVAKKYGIDDIYNPEQNIKAGISHLGRIKNIYTKLGADSSNVIKLTLAAYNCGEGRMKDCMALAKDKGLDPLVWDNIAQIIPLLREQEHYTNEVVKFGRFNGSETIKFVDIILERYKNYTETVEP